MLARCRCSFMMLATAMLVLFGEGYEDRRLPLVRLSFMGFSFRDKLWVPLLHGVAGL